MANLIGSVSQVLLVLQITIFAGVGLALVAEDAADAGWPHRPQRRYVTFLLLCAGVVTLLNIIVRPFLESH